MAELPLYSHCLFPTVFIPLWPGSAYFRFTSRADNQSDR
jgi:hypothetical protein